MTAAAWSEADDASVAGGGPSRTRRATRAGVTAVALLLPAAILFALSWGAAAATVDGLTEARRGVDYLRPLGAVVTTLADGRAALATGAQPDPAALRAAVGEVDGVDARLGAALGVSTRWQEVRARAVQAADGAPADGWGEAAALAAGLAAAAVEGSGAADEQRALAELAGVALPALLVASADHVAATVAVRDAGDDAAVATGREIAARDRLRERVAGVDDALARSVDPAAPSVADAVVARAGDLRAAVAPLVPAALVTAPPDDPQRVRSLQESVVRSGAELQREALTELGRRLDERVAATTTRQTVLGVVGALALLVAGQVLVRSLARRPERADRAEEPQPAGGVVMVDARSLLGADGDAEELVRVGRAVRRRRELEDDPV